MKPAAFEYHDPTSSRKALELLAQLGNDAKVLAGGQSLVPIRNFRLPRSAHLINLDRIAELGYLRPNGGRLCIGACRTLRDEQPVRSCLLFAAQVQGARQRTVELHAPAEGKQHPLEEAFREAHGLQCGY